MDFQARAKRISPEHRGVLFHQYLRRHDRINNWDLVDCAAPYVVGGYLSDQPRDVLYQLARSTNPWERRTAIVSTYYFIRQGDVEERRRPCHAQHRKGRTVQILLATLDPIAVASVWPTNN